MAEVKRFLDTAMQQAQQEPSAYLASKMLINIADGYNETGQAEDAKAKLLEARSLAHSVDERYISRERLDGAEHKLDLLISIALKLAWLGASSESMQTLAEAQTLSGKTAKDPSYYLPKLAEALALNGNLKEARAVGGQVRDGDEQLSALAGALRGFTVGRDPSIGKSLTTETRRRSCT